MLKSLTGSGLFLGLALAMTVTNTFPASPAVGDVKRVSKMSASAIRGGVFEASGVAHVPGTNGVIFADDGTSDAVFWTEFDGSGRQQGDAVRVPLGVTLVDPEGVTCDGTHLYVVGSQSKTEAGAGLVRFVFDPASRTATKVEAIDGLAALLRAKVPELARRGSKGGLNVEGLAWDADRNRLLLGLRDPVVDGNALVVPIALADPSGPFAAANLRVAEGGIVRLGLGGKGVRSIEFDPETKAFFVIAGAGDKDKRVDFTLWEWNGDPRAPSLRERATIDRDLKPEGVARVAQSVIVTCDVSTYFALPR